MPHPPSLEVTYERPANLKSNPRNARRHSEKQIAQIKASVIAFGFTNPVLVDERNRLIAGHGRLLAAKELGLEAIPVIRISHLSAVQKQALAIADNKIALNSSWDLEILSEELKILSSPDLEIDVGVTGFETAEIDLMIDGPDVSSETDPADKMPRIDRSKPAIAQMGDLWELGPHRLLCGNALEIECYVRLKNGEKAQIVITDPPYNVKIEGHVSGLGQAHHREFAMASGEMTSIQFTTFLKSATANMAAFTVNGSMHFIFMDWRHMQEILAAGTATYTELKNICVWNKTNGGMGSLYRSKHEFVFVFKNGTAPHINNIELGRHGRYRTNVWDYAGANSFGCTRKADLETHPTVKPVAMIADAIKDCSHRNDLILDPFGGSGTNLLAAERTGRRARLIELDPHYVDATIQRWEKMTGKKAQRLEGGCDNTSNAPTLNTETSQPRADSTPTDISSAGHADHLAARWSHSWSVLP